MNRTPTILISGSTEKKGIEMADASLSLAIRYPLALKAAGAMPWLLPCIPEKDFIADAVKRCHGVMLTGGDDIDPKLYTRNLPPRVARTVHCEDPARDAFEFALVEEVVRQRKPLLCICRGHQVINVALGGTLFADIKLQIPQARDHCRTDRKTRVVHEVSCAAGSLMARIAGKERLGVNSTHHQAVARIAKSLRATAVSDDGIVEGLELAADAMGMLPYLLSVQFHPERLFERHAEHLSLFRSFVSACCRKWRRKYEA